MKDKYLYLLKSIILTHIDKSKHTVYLIDLYLTTEEFRKHALKDAILWHRPMN
jgi:hypothetical protein